MTFISCFICASRNVKPANGTLRENFQHIQVGDGHRNPNAVRQSPAGQRNNQQRQQQNANAARHGRNPPPPSSNQPPSSRLDLEGRPKMGRLIRKLQRLSLYSAMQTILTTGKRLDLHMPSLPLPLLPKILIQHF